MHSAETNRKTKSRLNVRDIGPRFGSKNPTVGVCAIRGALTLAILSVLLIVARPAQARKQPNAHPGTQISPVHFATAVSYSTGGINRNAVAVADVNGDGKPDLIVASTCQRCERRWYPRSRRSQLLPEHG
jgi:hypothetical protein